MTTITKRLTVGRPLTNAEVDANFENLNVEKLERDGSIPMTGVLDTPGTQAVVDADGFKIYNESGGVVATFGANNSDDINVEGDVVVNEGGATVSVIDLYNTTENQAQQILNIISSVNDNTIAINDEASIREDADSALATQITNLQDQIDQSIISITELSSEIGEGFASITQLSDLQVIVNQNTAAIQSEATVRADEISALATQIESITASIGGEGGDITALITQEATARVSADEALAQQITTVQSTLNGNIASINSEITALVTETETLAQQLDNLTITFVDSSGVDISALVQQEALLRQAADDEIEGKYAIKVDLNGYVSGFGLISTANNATPTSEFAVVADKFSIAPVATNPNATDGSPFFVLTSSAIVDGVTLAPGTYMKKAFIHNASINSAKIEDLAVTNGKIANLAVNTLNIQGNAVTVPVNAIASSEVSGTGSYYTVLQLTVSETSGVSMPVVLSFNARMSYTGFTYPGANTFTITSGFRLLKNGSTIADPGLSGLADIYPSFQFLDVLSPGSSATYSVQFYGANSGVRLGLRSLTAIGVKR